MSAVCVGTRHREDPMAVAEPERLNYRELVSKIQTQSITDDEIARYFVEDRAASKPFMPALKLNEDTRRHRRCRAKRARFGEPPRTGRRARDRAEQPSRRLRRRRRRGDDRRGGQFLVQPASDLSRHAHRLPAAGPADRESRALGRRARDDDRDRGVPLLSRPREGRFSPVLRRRQRRPRRRPESTGS